MWTIEVKVGSSFHESPSQRLDEDGKPQEQPTEEIELDAELVNQLKHYDEWLCVQCTKHCGGFVLAMRDLSGALPPLRLKRRWTCISWTRLGLEIKAAVEQGKLPPRDDLLAKHLLGFIGTNLWRTEEMPETKLDFNDIALIRAFSKIGKDCERKINALLTNVLPIFGKVGFKGKVNSYERLYKWDSCSSLQIFLVPGQRKDADPTLVVAIGCEEPYGDHIGIWVLMSPNHPKREAVLQAVSPSAKKLRNPAWKEWSGDEEDWTVLELAAPLTFLLAADDQEKALQDYIRTNLTDLKKSGAVDAIVGAFAGSRRAKK